MLPGACQSNVESTPFDASAPAPIKSRLQGRAIKVITVIAVAAFTKIVTPEDLSGATKMFLTATLCVLFRAFFGLGKLKSNQQVSLESDRVKHDTQTQALNLGALRKAILANQEDGEEDEVYSNDIIEQARSICDYIEKHKLVWNQQVAENQRNLFISSTTELKRSVLCTTDGHIFIHLNKKCEGDRQVGKGCYKTVSLAFHYPSGEVLASSALVEEKAKNEINGYALAQQKKALHILPVRYTVGYSNKKRIKKVRILTPYCSRGDLSVAIRTNKLFPNEKFQITLQLIDAVIDWQSKELLHLDIKPSNIFLTESEIFVGDLASFCHRNDEIRIRQMQITPWYASPEFAKAILKYNSSKKEALDVQEDQIDDSEEKRKLANQDYQAMLKTISEKYDMWSLGCTLYQLHYQSVIRLPWAIYPEATNVYQAIANLDENWFPEPEKNSIKHLIWSMLRIDPAQRITHTELASRVSLLS